MENIALHGGEPVRKAWLSYGHQSIDEADIQAVTEVLKSDFLTCGPKVLELEGKLCGLTGAAHCTAVSNGTAALHVACLAAGIGPGDEAITTPMLGYNYRLTDIQCALALSRLDKLDRFFAR